ncbi:MAG: hypothetical protein QXE06_05315 [Candidatus Bathyarchaeia archaeon]
MRGGKFMMNGKGIWSKLGPIEIQIGLMILWILRKACIGLVYH